ncbi:MAG: hypothetical protein KF802_15280 [Bdellovibrionaceae bacterium]|nr:hypothetical protein [Pseudobdellovibrionaceae bacterium]MBX3033448.1 hypothetical protein [Pseudobdellovibrionaceae bacterium]
MKTSSIVLSCLVAFSCLTMVQSARASEEVEELSYEDLVEQLSSRQKAQAPPAGSPFDEVRIHPGLGFVNSFSSFQVDGKNLSRNQNGMQLSLGVDLFSPNWMAEVAWRNFGETRAGAEEHYLRELDLKFLHRSPIDANWDYRLQGGLAQRQLRLTDEAKNIRISDDTPAVLGSIGAAARLNSLSSLNFDLGARSPVVGRTADKGSVDFSVELKISL